MFSARMYHLARITSILGLLIILWYICATHLGMALSLSVALVGILLLFLATALLVASWLGNVVHYAQSKQYAAAIISGALGLWAVLVF